MTCADATERLSVLKQSRPTDGTFLEHYFRYRFAARFAKQRTVLDCACGTGYGTFMLARKAAEVIGIDNSVQALEIATANWPAENIRYHLMDVDRLDSLKQRFDLLVSFETIEHLAEPQAFLTKIADRLNPGGRLIISTPNKNSYRARLEPNPFHLREFTGEEFVAILSRNFRDTKVFGQMSVTLEDQIKMRDDVIPSSELRSGIVDAAIQYPLGYFLYLVRMKRRFSMAPTREYNHYRHLIAVCQKR